MDKEVFLLSVLLIITIGLGIFLVSIIFRQRLTPSAQSLIAMILGACLWIFGYTMEFVSPVFEAKLFWGKFQYLGITTIPLAWFSFAFQHAGAPGWSERSRVQRLALAAVPLLTLGLIWTNDFHRLIWKSVQLHDIGSFQILEIEHGPAFWLYLVYGYCLLIFGSLKLIGGMLVSFQISRWRTVLRMVAILIPWFGNLIYVTGLNPIPHLDWSPLSFTISGLLFAISLYNFSLIDLLPIAQKTVFAVLPDCLIVVDAQNHLVDMNTAAQKTICSPAMDWKGKPVAEVNSEIAHWLSLAGSGDEFRVETTRGIEQDPRFYELRIVPLTGSDRHPVGRLIVYHEITQHKRAQAQLEHIRAQLEESVAKRTAELRWAVEQLQNELTQRTMAEKRLEDVIESAPDAMVLIDEAGTVMLVNAQTEHMLGYARNELLGENIEFLIPPNQRQRLREYVRQFVVNPFVRQVSFRLTLSAQRKDGGLTPIEISLGTLNTADGLWIACNARDITERKKAEEEQSRLLEEIKQSREQLRALAIRLSELQEYEQRQIAIELHDRVGQNLTGLNLNLQVIQNQIPGDRFPAVLGRLKDSMTLVEETAHQVRSVMADLNPPLLEEYGLGAALRFACEQYMAHTGIETVLIGEELHPRLSQREEMALFRIVQEGLNNVTKHSRATKVEIRLENTAPCFRLSIEDNGQGFDPQSVQKPGSQPHWGLLIVRERAVSIGGDLQIQSASGKGTCLKITIPRGGAND